MKIELTHNELGDILNRYRDALYKEIEAFYYDKYGLDDEKMKELNLNDCFVTIHVPLQIPLGIDLSKDSFNND